jgi:hypothetical protein
LAGFFWLLFLGERNKSDADYYYRESQHHENLANELTHRETSEAFDQRRDEEQRRRDDELRLDSDKRRMEDDRRRTEEEQKKGDRSRSAYDTKSIVGKNNGAVKTNRGEPKQTGARSDVDTKRISDGRKKDAAKKTAGERRRIDDDKKNGVALISWSTITGTPRRSWLTREPTVILTKCEFRF